MIIKKAKNTGFCFGVKRAIDKAHQTLKNYKNSKPVFMLAEIVHNENVVNSLKKEGLNLVYSLKDIIPKSVLILKAHGTESEVYKKAKKKRLKIIDTTCPMVRQIHKKAKELERKSYKIAIFGDKNHEEIKALVSYIKNSLIIERKEDIRKIDFPQKTALLFQSTQDLEAGYEVLKEVAKKVKELLFINTVCKDTQLRQKEVAELSKKSNKVIIVGSKKSANTNRLYNISKRINKKTYWVESENQISKVNFRKNDKIAIISGASTPEEIVERIIKKLKSL